MFADLVVNPFGLDARTAVAAAVAAEDAGFSSVWTYDHLSGSVVGADSALDVWTILGAMAARTSRVGLGPLVCNVTTRHAAVNAVAAATLCQLAPGRVAVGLGAGAGPGSRFGSELDMVAIERRPDPERRQMVVEAAALMRAIWSGESDVEADHFPLRHAAGFLAVEPPPIIMGANGPKMAALAGQYADGVNLHAWEDDIDGLIEVARRSADRASRTVDVSVEALPDADWAEWLVPGGTHHDRLATLGVDRVMVAWMAEQGLDTIVAAGAWL
jgi:alkanesulfonate monooxygenase SsuD/methylene tetrahydromethanopterin reductase-like flavin-dependent oxidoreductase (luciferase family)